VKTKGRIRVRLREDLYEERALKDEAFRLRRRRRGSEGVVLFPCDPILAEDLKGTVHEAGGELNRLTPMIHPAECREERAGHCVPRVPPFTYGQPLLDNAPEGGCCERFRRDPPGLLKGFEDAADVLGHLLHERYRISLLPAQVTRLTEIPPPGPTGFQSRHEIIIGPSEHDGIALVFAGFLRGEPSIGITQVRKELRALASPGAGARDRHLISERHAFRPCLDEFDEPILSIDVVVFIGRCKMIEVPKEVPDKRVAEEHRIIS
jgi:hypothetical protein